MTKKYVIKADNLYWRTCYNGTKSLTSIENADVFSSYVSALLKYFFISLNKKGEIIKWEEH